jgi:AraC-like DNA-binding protein
MANTKRKRSTRRKQPAGRSVEKAFREHYIRPPIEELRHVRLVKAKTMLAEVNDKIITIARLTGYQTPHNLCRAFKQQVGLTPKQYRQSQKRFSTTPYVNRSLPYVNRSREWLRKALLPAYWLGRSRFAADRDVRLPRLLPVFRMVTQALHDALHTPFLARLCPSILFALQVGKLAL